MNIEIEVSTNLKDAASLIRWLEAEDTLTLDGMRQRSNPAKKGEMGPELLPIVTAVLVSPLLTELVKSVFGWLSATNHKELIKIIVDGNSVEFTASDVEAVKDIVDKLIQSK